MYDRNREDFGRIRNTREILILEAHLDDFEIGMSAWLQKQAQVPTKITLVTLCGKGRDFENGVSRNKKRDENLELFKRLYKNIEIDHIVLSYVDLTLDGVSLNSIIKTLENKLSLDFQKYKEIYFNQSDLHTDHVVVNQIGKILTRSYKGKVFEFIIKNSVYCSDNYSFNTEIKSEYKYSDDRYSEKFIYPCLYPSEKTMLQHILYNQKNYDGRYISDRFNLIKDIYVSTNT